MEFTKKNNLLWWTFFLLIMAMGGYFRLANIPTNPGWFTDEATHLEIARSIMDGRTQYLAVKDSVLLFSRVPLFGHLLAFLSRIFGLNMATLRVFTASLGVFSIGLLTVLVRRLTGHQWLAVGSAFVLAIFPAAVVYNRFGFSYNLLSPLFLLTCLGLWEFDKRGNNFGLAVASLSVGLGIISDLWMISCLPAFILLVLFANLSNSKGPGPRSLIWSLSAALLPISLYALISFLRAPDAFLFDVTFVRDRLSLSVADQIAYVATNLTALISQDGWIALGFAGMLALPGKDLRRFFLVFLLFPLLILGRSTALHNLGFHYFIPFFPFIALGIATLIRRGLPILARAIPFNNHKLNLLTAILLFSVPFLTTIFLLKSQVNGRFQTAIDPFLIEAKDAQAVAAYINTHLSQDDLVIATPSITWMLNTQRADFQMSIAASGLATPHLPADLPKERYAFDPDFHKAKLIVIDNWWYNWGQFNVPGLSTMINEVKSWPLVFSAGDLNVYQYPSPD